MLRCAAAVGLAVELRQASAGIGVADRRHARLIGALGAAAAEVVFIGRLPPGRVRRRREQLRLAVIGIGRRAAVGVRFMAAGSYRCDASAVQIVPESCVGVPADVFPFEPRSSLLIDIPPDMPSP